MDKIYDVQGDFRKKKYVVNSWGNFIKGLQCEIIALELKQIFPQLPSQLKVTFKWFDCGLKITYRLSHQKNKVIQENVHQKDSFSIFTHS